MLSIALLIILTCFMIYQVIIRENWSDKVPALFIVILLLYVIINITIEMLKKRKLK